MRTLFCFVTLVIYIEAGAQDSLYTRKVIKYLSSQECFGRGYVKNGLAKAADFIVTELNKSGAMPLFHSGYRQPFYHNVNTFPTSCKVKLNGKKLKPGIDFIPDPLSGPAKGSFRLIKKDSLHYVSVDQKVKITLKNKLTFSVGAERESYCGLEILKSHSPSEPEILKINLKSTLVKSFISENIACFINGTSGLDSLIVFTAHYDHLGGICNSVFFPGANDNASGVSMLLNLINYYQTNPPRYKTLFLFFAAEEAGLLGSKHFVASKQIDLSKIKFLINLDLLGTGDEGIMVVNGSIHDQQFQLLRDINTEKNYLTVVKKRGKAPNSDHYWFSEAGVPCFFIYTMGGIKAYHDVYDIEKTLPLTKYNAVFNLITDFAKKL